MFGEEEEMTRDEAAKEMKFVWDGFNTPSASDGGVIRNGLAMLAYAILRAFAKSEKP
jgi:hypothetical protein